MSDSSQNGGVENSITPAVSDGGVATLPAPLADGTALITVREAALLLHVSESWVRRHQHELPLVRTGRLVRFDRALLLRQFRGKQSSGNRLKTGGSVNLPLRRYQSGYVYKTGKRKKTWYGMYREDVRKPDGQIVRRQKNVRLGDLAKLPTKNAAQKALLELLTSPGPSVEMTFSELAQHWQHVNSRNLKATTADYYAKVLRAYLVPFFGPRTIATIARNELQEFLVEQSNHYSRSTVHGMKIALSLVMGHGVENEWLKKNPVCHIKSPREEYCGGKRIVRNKELTGAEVNAIAERLNEPYSTLVWFLSVTGLRIGEAVAIKWSDFKGNVLHVQRRIYEGAIDTPKGKKSKRLLPIPEELLQRLKSLGTKDWVFQARNGSPVNQSNILRRYLRPAVKALGITLGGWHDFRHSQSTVMRQGDVPAEVRAAILGHSVKQTEDYGQVNTSEFQGPLVHVANQLLRDVTKTAGAA